MSGKSSSLPSDSEGGTPDKWKSMIEEMYDKLNKIEKDNQELKKDNLVLRRDNERLKETLSNNKEDEKVEGGGASRPPANVATSPWKVPSASSNMMRPCDS